MIIFVEYKGIYIDLIFYYFIGEKYYKVLKFDNCIDGKILFKVNIIKNYLLN